VDEVEEVMAKQRKKSSESEKGSGLIDEQRTDKEHATTEQLRDINDARGDVGNPNWWKNEGGGSSEVH
jgi:hypothetical protein